MLNVLVAYEKPSWQKGIQMLLARHSFISASYTSLMGGDGRLLGNQFDVVLVEGGHDKARLRQNLAAVRKRFPRSHLVLVLENIGIRDLAFGHRMGICALIDERATSEQILASIEAAMRGDLYVSASVVRRGEAAFTPESEDELGGAPVEDLSEREMEVLGLVARGLSNKAIAKALYISEKTVKNHLYSIFRKIGVSDRTKAALYAVKGLASHKNGPYASAEVFFEIDERE